LTSEAFDDVVRLTALADDLQHSLDGAIKELEELRWRARELERRLGEVSTPGRPTQPPMAARPTPTPLPTSMNRQQRREAERVQRRAEEQHRWSRPPL
jgi:hypothetical protein